MTALSDNRATPRLEGPVYLRGLPVAAAVTIYDGALVLIDANGRAIPGTSTSAVGLVAAGVADGKADNASGSAGAINVTLKAGVPFAFNNSASTDAITIADRGRYCYVVDDQTVARTSNNGNRALAGIVEDVDSDGFVWVRVGEDSPVAPSGIDIYLVAAADLRTSKGFFVKVDSNGKAALCGAGNFAIGILVNAPNSAEIARVRIAGHAQVVTAATPAKGSLVASDANGKAVAATTAVTNTTAGADSATGPLIGSNVGAVLLETGAADTLTACIVVHSGAVPTTNA